MTTDPMQPDFWAPAPWVELRCRFLPDVPLWLVPTADEAEALRAEGIRPGRIWTHAEVLTLRATGCTRAAAEFAVRAKLYFDGELAPVP